MHPTRRSPIMRPVRRVLGGVALVTVLAGAAAGCSSAPPARSGFVDALVRSGISRTEARCVADAVYDSLTKRQLTDLMAKGDSGAPKDDPKRTDDGYDKVHAALSACQTAANPTTSTTAPRVGSSSTTAPLSTTGSGSTSTTSGTGTGSTSTSTAR